MNNLLKLILSLLLLACLFDFPYGYYQFVRFFATAVFAYFAYAAQQQHKNNEVFVFVALALLFQPFIKIALGRTLWNVVDVLVGLGLIVSVFYNNSKKKHIK